jgi:hypothetical protein
MNEATSTLPKSMYLGYEDDSFNTWSDCLHQTIVSVIHEGMKLVVDELWHWSVRGSKVIRTEFSIRSPCANLKL